MFRKKCRCTNVYIYLIYISCVVSTSAYQLTSDEVSHFCHFSIKSFDKVIPVIDII